MSKFMAFNVWDTLTSETKRHPGRCFAAVPYFGESATKLLPLKEGSTLVVDMSKTTVKAGLTNPSEILKLIGRGVNVHHVANLHAKVFVIGNRAYVGSANVSRSSRDRLIEAAIMTSDERTVASCRHFVQSLTGDRITPKFAEAMESYYHPPKFGGRARAGRTRKEIPITHSPLWLVPLRLVDWDDDDEEARNRGLPAAKADLQSEKRFRIDEFLWEGHGVERLKKDDLVIQILQDGRRKFVYATSRVLPIKRYRAGRSRRAIVFLEAAKGLKRKSLTSVARRLGSAAKRLRKLASPWRPRNSKLVHNLVHSWPA